MIKDGNLPNQHSNLPAISHVPSVFYFSYLPYIILGSTGTADASAHQQHLTSTPSHMYIYIDRFHMRLV